MSNNKFTPELIAPCGMNCAICRGYIAYTQGIPRVRGKITYCAGCLPRGKNCYIKRGCKKLSKHEIQSCSECDAMPCEKLAHLDKRYRERYDMSIVENLKILKEKGMADFLKSQEERYTCPSCGDVVCVHDAKCFVCGYTKEKL
jgi:hypothetical protein